MPVARTYEEAIREERLATIETISWDEPVVEEIELLPVEDFTKAYVPGKPEGLLASYFMEVDRLHVGEDLHEADIPGAPQGLLACYLKAEKK